MVKWDPFTLPQPLLTGCTQPRPSRYKKMCLLLLRPALTASARATERPGNHNSSAQL